MTRTDVHSPVNLVTEDYEFVTCGAFGEPDPYNVQLLSSLVEDGWTFGENESAGDCYHCGARLKYFAILKHVPSHTLIRVGETCLDNRFSLATREFQALRKRAALDRQAQRIKRHRAEWMAVHAPDAEVAFTWASERVENGDYGYNGMRHRFVSNVNRYGDVSDKFLRAVMRDMARTERMEAERAAREEREAEEARPVVEGRGVIEGIVLSVKWQENDFGGRLVMTVKDDRGFKVWGSVPRDLTLGRDDRGARVRFTATVEKSDRDETFGFFKRPTKAELLAEAAA